MAHRQELEANLRPRGRVSNSAAHNAFARSRARFALPILLASLTLLGSSWAVSMSLGFDQICPGYDTSEEGTSAHIEVVAWPPGAISCQIAAPDGSVREVTFMPWREYLTVALLVLAAVMGSLAFVQRRTHRESWLACACLLTVASIVVFFSAR